jgi:hypothetical protein
MCVDVLMDSYMQSVDETVQKCQEATGLHDEKHRPCFEVGALRSRLRIVLESIDSAARLDLSARAVMHELRELETYRNKDRQA